MIITATIIFFAAILFAFGMLVFRAWELRNGHVTMPQETCTIPEFSFRQFEKYVLYLTKRVVQWIVLIAVKYWFISVTKFKKWIADKWPRVNAFFQTTPKQDSATARPSYIRRAVAESRVKIRRVKEKIKREHAEKVIEEKIGVLPEVEIPESRETETSKVEE